MSEPFATALQARTRDVLDSCTRCGRCFEVCPMPAPADLADRNAAKVVGGVLDIIRGGDALEAERWAQVCSGSGHCIPACPEGVNPRFMLALARTSIQRRAPPAEQHSKGSAGFAQMGRGVRVLSRMQLPAEVLRRFRRDAPNAHPPDVVFYTGCNVLKTPHIVLLALDILDALGVHYSVMGGPGDCCGVIQFRTGDFDASGSIAYRTTDRFAASGARTVLAWCPTCTIQLGENVLPGRTNGGAAPPYAIDPFVVYLAGRLDRLRPLLRHAVRKRVGLHEHPGVAGVCDAAVALLRAVPGLDYIELAQTRVGYMCNTLQPLPAFKRDVHRTILESAAAAKVDVLAGVYHACHRELCSHEHDWPFEVVNFLELIGESMGIRREDQFKRLKKMQDANAILADVMDLVEAHGLDLDEVCTVIEKDLLGEQPLPLRRARAKRDATSAPG